MGRPSSGLGRVGRATLLGAIAASCAIWWLAPVPPAATFEISGADFRGAAWIILLVSLWGVGLGLVLTALLRERDRAAAEEAEKDDDDAADDEGSDRRRWLH
jgi:type VI protein secretion system component VasK